MTTPPVGIGDVVAGKYIIENTIGEGGMGVVFAARHSELERRVAIKFLLPEFAEQGAAAERFRREARAAARMRGEHVCRVLDVGTHEAGVPFMVMEYLEGRDLASELSRRGHLPIEESVGYVLEACEAVAEAHVAGIVHRDIKPANLFLETRSDGSRRVKVLDFGVSKSLLELKNGHSALTRTSSLVGSPLYMSPEQLDSARDVDARADVWALGVVLFELLTGNTPFQGETIPQLVAAVLMEAPVRMTDLPVVLPDGLIEVIQRALAKQRDRRFGSVAELAVALAPYAPPLARMSISRVRRLIDSKPPTLTPAADSPAGESTPNPLGVTPPGRSVQESQSIGGVPLSGASLASQSQSRRWLPLTLGLLFIAAGAGFFLWRRGVVSPHGQHSPVVADEAPAATVQPRMLPEPSAPQAPNTVAVSVAGTGVGVAGAAAAAVAEVPVSTPVGRTDAISPSATQEPASAVRPSSRSPAKAAAAEPAHSKPSTKTSRSSEARPESAPPSSISDFGGRR